MKRLRSWLNSRLKKSQADLNSHRNEYYENISVRFGITQVVLFLLLFAFVILSLFANTDLITYKNFNYFFRDLRATAESVDIFETDSLSYPTDEAQSFTLYRKGLAVAGNSAVTVFSATGRQILSVPISYRNPAAVGTGKYLLVYEAGGTHYSLYNSDVQIHIGTTEYPIFGAEVSESGRYALITSSADYTSVISLYSDRFSLLSDYNFKDKYVMDVALNAVGSRIAVLCSVPRSGAFSTSLCLAEVGKTTPVAEPEISDSLGLSCSFTEAGKIATLCTDRITYLSDGGKVEKNDYRFDGMIPTQMDVGAHGVAVALKSSTVSESTRLLVLDKNGVLSYERTVTDKIAQLSLTEKSLFLKVTDGIRRIRLRDGQEEMRECVTDHRVLLAVSDTEVLCCSPQKAVYIGFD